MRLRCFAVLCIGLFIAVHSCGQDGAEQCSGHGMCDSFNQCVCQPPFTTASCAAAAPSLPTLEPVMHGTSMFLFGDCNVQEGSAVSGRVESGGKACSNVATTPLLKQSSFVVDEVQPLSVSTTLKSEGGQLLAIGTHTQTRADPSVPDGHHVDFKARAVHAFELSRQLYLLPATGEAVVVNRTLTLTSSSPHAVFALDADKLPNLKFVVLRVPPDASVLINVRAGATATQAATLTGSISGDVASKTLWNFGEMTTLTLDHMHVAGLVLAPAADVTCTGQGSLTGQLVARSLTGVVKLTGVAFEGEFPIPASPPALEVHPRALVTETRGITSTGHARVLVESASPTCAPSPSAAPSCPLSALPSSHSTLLQVNAPQFTATVGSYATIICRDPAFVLVDSTGAAVSKWWKCAQPEDDVIVTSVEAQGVITVGAVPLWMPANWNTRSLRSIPSITTLACAAPPMALCAKLDPVDGGTLAYTALALSGVGAGAGAATGAPAGSALDSSLPAGVSAVAPGTHVQLGCASGAVRLLSSAALSPRTSTERVCTEAGTWSAAFPSVHGDAMLQAGALSIGLACATGGGGSPACVQKSRPFEPSVHAPPHDLGYRTALAACAVVCAVVAGTTALGVARSSKTVRQRVSAALLAPPSAAARTAARGGLSVYSPVLAWAALDVCCRCAAYSNMPIPWAQFSLGEMQSLLVTFMPASPLSLLLLVLLFLLAVHTLVWAVWVWPGSRCPNDQPGDVEPQVVVSLRKVAPHAALQQQQPSTAQSGPNAGTCKIGEGFEGCYVPSGEQEAQDTRKQVEDCRREAVKVSDSAMQLHISSVSTSGIAERKTEVAALLNRVLMAVAKATAGVLFLPLCSFLLQPWLCPFTSSPSPAFDPAHYVTGECLPAMPCWGRLHHIALALSTGIMAGVMATLVRAHFPLGHLSAWTLPHFLPFTLSCRLLLAWSGRILVYISPISSCFLSLFLNAALTAAAVVFAVVNAPVLPLWLLVVGAVCEAATLTYGVSASVLVYNSTSDGSADSERVWALLLFSLSITTLLAGTVRVLQWRASRRTRAELLPPTHPHLPVLRRRLARACPTVTGAGWNTEAGVRKCVSSPPAFPAGEEQRSLRLRLGKQTSTDVVPSASFAWAWAEDDGDCVFHSGDERGCVLAEDSAQTGTFQGRVHAAAALEACDGVLGEAAPFDRSAALLMGTVPASASQCASFGMPLTVPLPPRAAPSLDSQPGLSSPRAPAHPPPRAPVSLQRAGAWPISVDKSDRDWVGQSHIGTGLRVAFEDEIEVEDALSIVNGALVRRVRVPLVLPKPTPHPSAGAAQRVFTFDVEEAQPPLQFRKGVGGWMQTEPLEGNVLQSFNTGFDRVIPFVSCGSSTSSQLTRSTSDLDRDFNEVHKALRLASDPDDALGCCTDSVSSDPDPDSELLHPSDLIPETVRALLPSKLNASHYLLPALAYDGFSSSYTGTASVAGSASMGASASASASVCSGDGEAGYYGRFDFGLTRELHSTLECEREQDANPALSGRSSTCSDDTLHRERTHAADCTSSDVTDVAEALRSQLRTPVQDVVHAMLWSVLESLRAPPSASLFKGGEGCDSRAVAGELEEGASSVV